MKLSPIKNNFPIVILIYFMFVYFLLPVATALPGLTKTINKHRLTGQYNN